MKSSAAKMSYDLYRLLPDDGKRYELIDGELIMMTPAPTPQHQRILKQLGFQLSAFVETNGLGEVFIAPVDIVLEDHTVVEPDILFVSRERRGIVGEEAIHGAPDVVVEILSPSSFYHDLRRKMGLYSQFGVQEYWIVDPEKQAIDLYVRAGNELKLTRQFASHETFESPLLGEFRLAVSAIF
jgi:Uma2 family endonuclease